MHLSGYIRHRIRHLVLLSDGPTYGGQSPTVVRETIETDMVFTKTRVDLSLAGTMTGDLCP